jgi:hypothetical protein
MFQPGAKVGELIRHLRTSNRKAKAVKKEMSGALSFYGFCRNVNGRDQSSCELFFQAGVWA